MTDHTICFSGSVNPLVTTRHGEQDILSVSHPMDPKLLISRESDSNHLYPRRSRQLKGPYHQYSRGPSFDILAKCTRLDRVCALPSSYNRVSQVSFFAPTKPVTRQLQLRLEGRGRGVPSARQLRRRPCIFHISDVRPLIL